jgi:hypothetical protein
VLNSIRVASSVPQELSRILDRCPIGRAILVRPPPGGAQALTLHRRLTPHVRHLHKYAEAQLPFEHRFFFRRGSENTGSSAGNLSEFDRVLRHQDAGVIKHHALNRDFSRWIRDVVQDDTLAAEISYIEADLARDTSAVAVENTRMGILRTIAERYLSRRPGLNQ